MFLCKRRVTGQVLNASGGEWYQTDDSVVIGDEVRMLKYISRVDNEFFVNLKV